MADAVFLLDSAVLWSLPTDLRWVKLASPSFPSEERFPDCEEDSGTPQWGWKTGPPAPKIKRKWIKSSENKSVLVIVDTSALEMELVQPVPFPPFSVPNLQIRFIFVASVCSSLSFGVFESCSSSVLSPTHSLDAIWLFALSQLSLSVGSMCPFCHLEMVSFSVIVDVSVPPPFQIQVCIHKKTWSV